MDVEKKVLLLREKKKWIVDTVTQSHRIDHWKQLASTSLSPGNVGQTPGYSPWHSQAYWCYGSTAFRGWGDPETTTIMATMTTAWLSDQLELGVYTFEMQPVFTSLWMAWHMCRDIFNMCRWPFFWKAVKSLLINSSYSLVFLSVHHLYWKTLQASSASFYLGHRTKTTHIIERTTTSSWFFCWAGSVCFFGLYRCDLVQEKHVNTD